MATDYQRCAELIRQADGLLITAGAGIGVDSGMPDFRGPQGFWGAYPALGRARIAFEEIANPAAFASQPRLAWGFYGHRLQLYRRTVPHEGFQILRRIGECLPHGAHVFTSNVDGQFQKAGFAEDRVSECHGSIHHLQCLDGCHDGIWPAREFDPEIDEEQCLLISEFPRCPRCRGIARPNILMFGDWGWRSERSDVQEAGLRAWLRQVGHPLVIEIGAGTRIPTARRMSERVKGQLIRINPTEPQLPDGKGVSIAAGGLAALRAIAAACLL
ncbi:MAG TPA: Sir2 family NAD-dependent protein deacetylase [Accumulibacter sp.]|uniref:protein acetyllysine N-acetyltransferase n=1 Tax=Candidatus Accumulibacter cognatus TaxID=2954383 RepID=A0A7D5N7U1_9PROT|nr:Sir2 family NAD-dependent protein deacetylase [Accumulibacter sp.]MCC2869558.1 NAD-dependent deacetylase [Candidatus Accumulibacter phosphatis]QLH48595.1 MAG: NAD-dependent deacetylase [Candidatus Accumulibacter cognatus]MBL8402167.1 NAD-dependent deacetylase [Accumulibacter sp.]MBO3711894.1 NAD-dependent deacetylase [Accumulibacter sp.]MCM8580996.1 NAD-dependent deacetylase [Accumulibacter sp.]